MDRDIKTILWDNDGVLVDTEELYFRACREILATQGEELTQAHYREVSLRQGASVFDQLLDHGVSGERILELRQERNQVYTRLLLEGTRVCAGVEDVLAALAGRFQMGIVTTTLREHFQAAHSSSGLVDYFAFVVTREDYRLAKPNPDPYLTALRLHGLDASRCVAVEDSERGLRSAVAAGIRCYVVPNHLTCDGDYSAAEEVLDSIGQLPSRVDSARSK